MSSRVKDRMFVSRAFFPLAVNYFVKEDLYKCLMFVKLSGLLVLNPIIKTKLKKV